MNPTIPESVILEAIERNKNGESFHAIARSMGYNSEAIRQRAVKLGHTAVRHKIKSWNKLNLPDDEVIALYAEGMSENELSKHYGCSRNAIRTVLISGGVKIRGASEAEQMKWSKMTPEQRLNQVRTCHESVTGVPMRREHRQKIALSRQNTDHAVRIGKGEREFEDLLIKQGIQYTTQKAVDIYNLDFLIDGIAVEITTYQNRYIRNVKRCIDRAQEIYDHSGYHMLGIEVENPQFIIDNFDCIIGLISEMALGGYSKCQFWALNFKTKSTTILKREL